MKTKLAGLSAAALLATSLSMPASAAFIIGAISFSDGFSTIGNIVSDLTVMDVGPTADTSSAVLAFAGLNGSGNTVANNIDTNAPGGVIYAVGGFSFTLSSISNLGTTAFACANFLCSDEIEFNLQGVVTGNGFQATAFAGNWTANGTCVENSNAPGTCLAGSRSASWSSSIAATGRDAETPVPATLALLGLALAGLGWTRRSKA